MVFYSADCTMDGLSASFEAVAYVPFDRNEGTVRVRLTEGSNASVINAYLSGCEELGGNVCRFYSDYPVQLKENTTYYWQPYYYSYSSQNYDAEEWMKLTTGSHCQHLRPGLAAGIRPIIPRGPVPCKGRGVKAGECGASGIEVRNAPVI